MSFRAKGTVSPAEADLKSIATLKVQALKLANSTEHFGAHLVKFSRLSGMRIVKYLKLLQKIICVMNK